MIRGILDAGEKLSFARKAAVDIEGDESGREKPVDRLAVFRLDGVVPGRSSAMRRPARAQADVTITRNITANGKALITRTWQQVFILR